MAVALSVIQTADAAPLVIDIALDIPRFPAIELAAFAAYQAVGKCVFACVAGATCHSRFGWTAQGAASCHFCFYRIILLPTDDAFVVVLDQVFRKLPGVFDHFLADNVRAERLLQQHIAAVFFVCQDTLDGGDRPCCAACHGRLLSVLQPVFEFPKACAGQIARVKLPHDLGLLRNRRRLSVRALFIRI